MNQEAVFPKSWSAIGHPHARWAVIGCLEELSDINYQHEKWINRNVKDIEEREKRGELVPVEDFDNTVQEFLDSQGLGDEEIIFSAVGSLFFDRKEAYLVKTVSDRLIEIIDILRDADAEVYLCHPKWKQVIESAAAAYEYMKTKGLPDWA